MPNFALGKARLTDCPRIDQAFRPVVRGKFIFVGDQKFFVKGVTYGSFKPNEAGLEFHDLDQIRADFAMMAKNGINTVRIQHTTPPIALLDLAAEYRLRVMVGLSAEQHIGYLLDGKGWGVAIADVRSKVEACKGHAAVLCYALGNEIPAGIARWLGRKRIERYLRALYDVVKETDPKGLVTYVNYPGTEYLQLPFLDFCSFNVYLEEEDQFAAYLARLQNIALDRPLIMSELGLDSQRNGENAQAEVLDWQIRATFAAGCAGAVVFSWTDEWHSGGGDISDWAFGLTDRTRQPKPGLSSVHRAFRGSPFPPQDNQPFISVVVCSYNGSRTIEECLTHLTQLNYPLYEVIVVDDGSTDQTPEIAGRFNVRLVRTTNCGLSSARNTGRMHAHGEIVVYIDDDAYPDPDWLNYYSQAFQNSDHAMIGGPNLSPLGDPLVSQCVARSPGGPNHVLLTDTLAEHVPGCNMAFRKSCLEEIGGFDPMFRVAGDDVDVCWRIQEKGWTIGFAPAALVWHHRRSSVRAYLKQQRGYGKAEALLQKKWPGKFNTTNHLPWAGRIYTAGVNLLPGKRPVVHHGVWGESPFQSLYGGSSSCWEHLLEIPELHLLNLALLILSTLGLLWPPMLMFLPLLLISSGYPLVRAVLKAREARFTNVGRIERWKLRSITAVLHVLQPLARLWGRMRHGLTPWKRRGKSSPVFPYSREQAIWTENWVEPHERLSRLEKAIGKTGHIVVRGNEYESWDLEVVGGLFGSARLLMAVENHGSGRQYVRLSAWPRFSVLSVMLAVIGMLLAGGAFWSGQVLVAVALAGGSALLFSGDLLEAGRSLAAVRHAAQLQDREVQTVVHEIPLWRLMPHRHDPDLHGFRH